MNATIRSTPLQEILSYSELQDRIHHDLLEQHPEWIEANGACPTCDEYDRRFAQLISFFRTGNLNSVQRAA